MLAGTYIGLMMFDGNAWQNVNLGKNVGKPAVVRILIASNNTIWLGTEGGRFQGILPSWQQYEPDEGESRLATLARGNPNESRLKLAIDEAQRVHRWRDGQWQLETPLSAHPLSFDYYHFGDSETLWCLLLQQVLAFSLVDGTQTGPGYWQQCWGGPTCGLAAGQRVNSEAIQAEKAVPYCECLQCRRVVYDGIEAEFGEQLDLKRNPQILWLRAYLANLAPSSATQAEGLIMADAIIKGLEELWCKDLGDESINDRGQKQAMVTLRFSTAAWQGMYTSTKIGGRP